MTTVIQNLFGREDLHGSRNRPDFAVLPDSSVGLYSYPRYDDYGGEIGVDRLVIIELKKPGVVVSEEEKSQSWKYVKELYLKGLLLDGTRVDCYVLGSQIDQNECGVRTERNERVRIQPLSFDTVLARARSRLLKLYDRVKAAPFLQGKDVDKFFNGTISPEDELPLDGDAPFTENFAPEELAPVAAVNEENAVEDCEPKPSGHSL